MKVESTNTPSEQVVTDTGTNDQEQELTNAEEVSQESTYDNAYDKAFEEMDLDNPDMTTFAEQSNVEEESEQPESTDEIPENIPSDNNPFALDEDGYLKTQLIDRGREVRVTPEELFAFGSKGLNYEDKNAELKPFKPYMKIFKEQNVDVEDVKALADLVGGKKEALKHLISKYDVDVYDVDSSEEQYTPEVEEYNSDPVSDIWSDFQQQDPTGSEVVAGVFNGMDESFRQEVYNEKTFGAFADDVKKGIFDELYPETQKIKALNPNASWIDAYSEANRRSMASKQKKQVPESVTPPRDLGTPSSNKTGKADDIWGDDASFAAFQDRMTI